MGTQNQKIEKKQIYSKKIENFFNYTAEMSDNDRKPAAKPSTYFTDESGRQNKYNKKRSKKKKKENKVTK